MVDSLEYVICIPAEGAPYSQCLPENTPHDDALLAALLHTDVTERLRLPETPAGFPADAALCYFIDARGGEKSLPVNLTGTCFYHTGCPIHGGLLLAKCSIADPDGQWMPFSQEEVTLLLNWLNADFTFNIE